MRPGDVAEMLAVSRAWVYDAAKTGRIPSVRIGGDDGPLRFVPADIESWLAEARAAWTPGTARARRAESSTPERSRRDARPQRRRKPADDADQQRLI
ncbi:MAG: helix-turn-helix domain-containing protein [Solirubrobacteraceae bacterium]